jgi:hypothetical protein
MPPKTRPARTVEARYPNAEIGRLALIRKDCQLVWSIRAFIDQPAKPPLLLEASVDNSTGEMTLPKGRHNN